MITKELKIGSSGEDVRLLQYLLGKDRSLYPSNLISGYYGQLTFDAVKNFQGRYGLSLTGIVDPGSINKINEIYGSNTKSFYLSLIPTAIPIIQQPSNNNSNNNEEWGKAKQISEHTWSMKIGYDERMATPQEIYEALNTYRQKHGKNTLSWDDKLANYANSRVETFFNIGKNDEHAGFNEFLKNGNAFEVLGFYNLGENSSYGYKLLGVHIIEWIYAGDKPHDDNQLSSGWTHVGIGVKGTMTDLIFGGSKK